ncbi:Molybdopterin binding protein, partial [Rhizoctonia solani]
MSNSPPPRVTLTPPPSAPISLPVSPIPAGDGNPKTIKTAACLIIGDEILNGKTHDSNSNYFAKFCFERGVALKRIEVIADDEGEIVEASRRMVKNYDFVVTSGGIGPTHDDITYASLGVAFNNPLVLHQPTLERMYEMSKHRPETLNQTQEQRTARERMALLPEGPGAEALFVCEDLWVPVSRLQGKLYVLPGVPSLFQKLLDGMVPFLSLPDDSEPRVKPEDIQVGSYPTVGKGVTVSLIGRDSARLEELALEVAKEVSADKSSSPLINHDGSKRRNDRVIRHNRACTGALSGAVYALFKSQSPALMGFSAGINTKPTLPPPLSRVPALREYVVSPALVLSLDTSQYAQRRARLGITSKQFNDLKYAHEHQDELAMIRRDRLLDTGVAGAIAGGGLNFWRRGARAIVPGVLTAGLACTLVQVAVNELAVQRIRYVAGTPTTALVSLTPSIPVASDSASPTTSTSNPIATPIVAVLHQPVEEKQAPKPAMERIVDALSYVIPLTKLDDKEYLGRLERKRTALDEKIDRLSAELDGKSRR